ncbi:MAG TPA: zf-HC2 domain-containing protein [Gemmatimonadaceae bacterium]
MDCRDFRRNHVAFVDDLLPGIDLVRMQRHLIECERCAHHDALVRRALLVVRNIPDIEPSPDFSERLQARIQSLKAEAPNADRGLFRSHPGAFVALATGVVAAGLLAFTVTQHVEATPRDLVLPPVVASLPTIESDPFSSSIAPGAMVATASTGIGVWSAVLAAEQAPLHFAQGELRLVNYTGR